MIYNYSLDVVAELLKNCFPTFLTTTLSKDYMCVSETKVLLYDTFFYSKLYNFIKKQTGSDSVSGFYYPLMSNDLQD